MRKIIVIIFLMVCSLFIASCDVNNNNNQTQDPSLDGIDISKYEMPQTDFLNDGHTLTKLEEVMKFIILEGEFCYDKHLNSIGYKYILEESYDEVLYAFYHLSELRIIYLTTVGKVAHTSYFKLSDDEDFSICHKIQYYSGRRQDFLAIMPCVKAEFNASYLGEYELYRGHNTQTKEEINKKSMLENYGTNLTRRARNGELEVVVGREKEIERVLHILNRKTKNNPVLLGEPGVGKTAVAEGVAISIVNGAVPDKLLDFEVYLIDFTALLAGTQFRGQFEGRLKKLIDEVKQRKNVILVIDELHNIVSAGDAEGAMNAANILKPALSRGEIRVIGATTFNEYRKHIEKDSALERRFAPVNIDEPSEEDSFEILKGLRPFYETYHKITLSDEVLKTAVSLSKRYIPERFLPDKAIDLIDECGSKKNLENKKLAGNCPKRLRETTSLLTPIFVEVLA